MRINTIQAIQASNEIQGFHGATYNSLYIYIYIEREREREREREPKIQGPKYFISFFCILNVL